VYQSSINFLKLSVPELEAVWKQSDRHRQSNA